MLRYYVFAGAFLLLPTGFRVAGQTQEPPGVIDLNGSPPVASRSKPPAYRPFANPVRPEYTPEARAAGAQGSVILAVVVTQSGDLKSAVVVQSLGYGLDQKAIEAVRLAGFKPGPADGPAETMQSAEVKFVLDSAAPWQIRRLGTAVKLEKLDGLAQKPVLTQFAAPSAAACGAEPASVLVKFVITKEGNAAQLELIGAQPSPASQAALAALSSWRFQPGSSNKGEPREADASVELECGLPNAPDAFMYRAGGGVNAPALTFKVEPQYSEEARKAKAQGTTLLQVVVDATGHAVNVVVKRPLGFGLDEKAIEAVSSWKFHPATRAGQPVATQAQIEVNFRLL